MKKVTAKRIQKEILTARSIYRGHQDPIQGGLNHPSLVGHEMGHEQCLIEANKAWIQGGLY